MKKSYLVLIFMLIILLAMSTSLMAADQVVTNNNDTGAGSLRQAIVGVTTGCTITFNLSSGNETITTASQFSISGKDFTIDGDNTAGSGTNIILQANANPWTATHRLFYISSSGTDLTVKNMTLQNANTTSDGGAFYIRDAVTLTIENCTVRNNRGKQGGFLFISNGSASCTADNCTIFGNKAHNTFNNSCGGGVYFLSGGTFTATNSTFSENKSDYNGSGGFLNFRATSGSSHSITLTNCTISGNEAGTCGTCKGGAIFIYVGSDNGAAVSVSLTNCTIDGNTGNTAKGIRCETSWT
ncbi:MAG: hypothetical protein KAT74_11910, partial [Candidatus Cloacimonetes bacterium]|nr:hypothetical protein [Candidatus Cloacimonadota bacterium]